RDDADGATAPALVEQLHGAGGAFSGNLEPGDVVAQFDGKIETRIRLAIPDREVVAGLADRRALGVERAYDTVGGVASGAQHLHGHFGRRVFGRHERKWRRRAAI